MNWTAEQERENRAAQEGRTQAIRRVCRGFAELASSVLSEQQAADIILHADALIALLQPFASAPAAPEPAVVDSTGDADGWIENTGKRLVDVEVRVDTRFLNGSEHFGAPAGSWAWRKTNEDDDITHWRLHKPQESKA
jgi:hypothetical protein